jgi:uncharacterized membrane protein
MTYTDANQGTAQAPEWLTGAVRTIENEQRLDQVAERLQTVAGKLGEGRRGELLKGNWLGHAVHPLLTDFPLGMWMSANVLDLVGGKGSRKAAQRLVGLGLLAVPATAATGMADWGTVRDERAKRVGVVHAVGNSIVGMCYFRSWRKRRKGKYLSGKVWALVGGLLAWGTGYLGGHLSFGRGVGQGVRGMDLESSAGERELLVNLSDEARRDDLPVEGLRG